MNRSKYLKLGLLLLACSRLTGQGDPDSGRITLGYPVFSQYLHNGLMINPAYAGSREALSVAVSYRMQWMGIADAPRLYSVSLHTPMKNDRVSLGMKARFMSYGVSSSRSIQAVYSFRIRLREAKLSFGLNAGVDMSNTNYGNLRGVTMPDDLFLYDRNHVFPNVGAGIYYYMDKFFAGLSIPSFLFYKNSGNGNTQAYHSFSEYNFLFSAGGLFTYSPSFKFKPSILIDYSMHDTKRINQFDLNANFIVADIIWFGGAWRMTEEVVVGMIQAQATPQLMFGISYDYPVGRMNNYSKGSSEFFIRYEFGTKVSVANPRYF
jgi:type IX secretion system PorP/SprF family membrane protein